jgi:hypothetical protein
MTTTSTPTLDRAAARAFVDACVVPAAVQPVPSCLDLELG